MKLTDAIKKFFQRRLADKTAEQQPSATPHPLRISGVKSAPLTPEPDDAELAAQALLETLASDARADLKSDRNEYKDLKSEKKRRRIANADTHSDGILCKQSDQGRAANPAERAPHDAAYYRRLAERIRLAQDQATLRAMRFLTWCEHELEKCDLPIEGKGSLAQMEAELYKRIDTIERVGGELKHRWQHCLATVTVRLMQADRMVEEERENEE